MGFVSTHFPSQRPEYLLDLPLARSLMPGPYHDFLLLSQTECDFSDYMQFINDPRAIHVEDDLIRYMADTLAWIPTHNPSTNEFHYGLCTHGPTVIHTDGASSAAAIFDAWATLLDCAPATTNLTGGWSTIEGDPPGTGQYEQIDFARDEAVPKLRLIADYAKQIVETNGDYFILHSGV